MISEKKVEYFHYLPMIKIKSILFPKSFPITISPITLSPAWSSLVRSGVSRLCLVQLSGRAELMQVFGGQWPLLLALPAAGCMNLGTVGAELKRLEPSKAGLPPRPLGKKGLLPPWNPNPALFTPGPSLLFSNSCSKTSIVAPARWYTGLAVPNDR